jgi:hypothetical protein
MKNIFLLLISLIVFQNISYAAFPVTENNNATLVASELPVSGVDDIATTSMILAGIAVFFNIILLTSSGLGMGAVLFVVLAGLFYIAGFILGLIGLWSKTKKWQAFIGLFSGLLVLLILAISAGSTGYSNAKD